MSGRGIADDMRHFSAAAARASPSAWRVLVPPADVYGRVFVLDAPLVFFVVVVFFHDANGKGRGGDDGRAYCPIAAASRRDRRTE